MVEVVVRLAPAPHHAVRRGRRRRRGPARGAGCARRGPRWSARSGGAARRRRRCRAPRRGCRPRRRWGGSGPRRPGAASSCRRRWARAPPSARRRRPATRSGRAASPGPVGRSRRRTRSPRPCGNPSEAGRSGARRVTARATRAPRVGAPGLVGNRLAAWSRRRRPGASTRSWPVTRPTSSPGCPGSRARSRSPGPWPSSARPARPAIGIALPVAGDPVGLGGPAAFNAAALDAGEATVVRWRRAGPAPGRRRVEWTAYDAGHAAAGRRRRGGPCAPARAPASGHGAGRPRRGPLAARGRRRADEPPPPAPRWRRHPGRRRAAPSSRRRSLQALGDRRPRARGRRRCALSAAEATRRRESLQPLGAAARRGLVAACSPEVWPGRVGVRQ